MQNLFLVIAYVLPFVIAAGMAVGLIAVGVTASKKSVLLVLVYLVFLYCASEISYGELDAKGGSLYSKGAGVLVFPAIVWGIVASLVWLRVCDGFARQPSFRPSPTLAPFFIAWGVLLLAHVGVSVALDQSFRDTVGPSGFSNIILMGLMASFVVATVRSERDLCWLLNFMLVAGFARAVFGLVRWAAFGGDPANAYANRHGLSLKLTFFDVYASLICTFTICIAALRLFSKEPGEPPRLPLKIFFWLCLILPAMCIVLSFRRTAVIGFLMAGAFVLFHLSRSGRLQLLLLGTPAILAAGGYSIWARLSQTHQAGGLSGLLFDITPARVGPDTPRLLELLLAWDSFIQSPVVGVGSWGAYAHWRLVSWQLYEGGGGSYLHSGVLHIGLKTGLVGLTLLALMIWAFVRHWRRASVVLTGQARVLAVVGVAGALFVLPDFVIGTSLTKYRAAMFIGFCLALPYAACAVQRVRLGALQRQAGTAGKYWGFAARRGAGQPSALLYP